jgi:tetratricopeptide (TPR) repeat protein
MKRVSWLIVLLLVVAARPAMAQIDFSEARGKVVDRDGNPVAGAVVTFSPKSDPSKHYAGETNKKGAYTISGLYTVQENDRWRVTLEVEGFLPTDVRIESRNVSRVLLGEIMNVKLKGNSNVPEFPLSKMGTAVVDFTVAPEAIVRQELAAEAPAPAAPGTGAATAEAAAKADPWVEALSMAGAGKLEESLPLFQEAIGAEPENAERHETHAKILYKLGRYDEALTEGEQARRLAPDSVSAAMVVYSAHVGKGDLAAARGVIEQTRKIAPSDPRVLEQLGYVANAMKDKAAAIEAYEAVTKIDPTKADAWLALGGLYAENKDMKRSAEAYQRVSELNPDSAYETFFNLGAIIMNDAKHSEADARRAVEAFRKALEIKSDYGPALKQLGFALLELGDQPGAREALDRYVTTHPNASDVGQIKGLVAALKP